MTQPSEQSIRKACEEAGVIAGDAEGNAWRALLALARRIAREREAVPVETYQRDIGLRDEYAHSLEARATAAEAEVVRLKALLQMAVDWDAYDDEGVPAIWLEDARAALETDNG